jgi:tetraacyldisaccharide 4'-kinase
MQAEAAGDPAAVEARVRRHAPAAAIAHARYEVETVDDLATGARLGAEALRGRPALAFAGIAVPDNFRRTLLGLEVALRDLVAFPDHHPYTAADVAALEARARAAGAGALITTEKDAVRLPAAGTLPVWVVRVRLRLRDTDSAWWSAFDARVASA